MPFVQQTLPHPDTPQQWYIRARTVRDWTVFQYFKPDTLQQYLTKKWSELSTSEKVPYNKLYNIDTKRCTALKIEKFFEANGLEIGAHNNTLHNIIVSLPQTETRLIPTSELLFSKMTKIMFEL